MNYSQRNIVSIWCGIILILIIILSIFPLKRNKSPLNLHKPSKQSKQSKQSIPITHESEQKLSHESESHPKPQEPQKPLESQESQESQGLKPYGYGYVDEGDEPEIFPFLDKYLPKLNTIISERVLPLPNSSLYKEINFIPVLDENYLDILIESDQSNIYPISFGRLCELFLEKITEEDFYNAVLNIPFNDSSPLTFAPTTITFFNIMMKKIKNLDYEVHSSSRKFVIQLSAQIYNCYKYDDIKDLINCFADIAMHKLTIGTVDSKPIYMIDLSRLFNKRPLIRNKFKTATEFLALFNESQELGPNSEFYKSLSTKLNLLDEWMKTGFTANALYKAIKSYKEDYKIILENFVEIKIDQIPK